jgi:hypothetical protein
MRAGAVDGHLKGVYNIQVKQKGQHGGRRPGAGRKRNLTSTGMALTVRLDWDEMFALLSLATNRRISMRHLIVDLIREHFKLPAKPHKACYETVSGVGTWLRTKGRPASTQPSGTV